MKSLILKDLYNISHNSKVMLAMLLLFAFTTLPQGGTEGYIVMCCLLCSMMVVTTFSFDENSKWTKYALVLPLSKKDYVLSKFIILLIFSLIGAAFGLVFGSFLGVVLHKFSGSFTETLLSQLFIALIGVALSITFGSFTIPRHSNMVLKSQNDAASCILVFLQYFFLESISFWILLGFR